MADLYLPEGFFITTLSSDLTASATSIPLTTVPSDVTKGYLVIEPTSATKREVVHFTSVGASTVTAADDTTDANDATGRGCKGSINTGANTSHDQGVTVLIAATYQYWKRLYDKLTGNDTTVLVDTNGNEMLKVSQVASAVNEITLKNAATGNPPELQATGGDTNINFKLSGKGTGDVETTTGHQFDTEAFFDAEVDNGNSGAADTIDWTAGNKQKSTLTGNCTYTFTAPSGPCNLVLVLVQDATGSRTVTWPAAVKWPAGTAPTLSTAASAIDIISFYYDGTNYYGQSALNFS